MREFGERTQRARKEHFCDWCCEWIQPGQSYTRKIWVHEKGGFIIMKEHSMPGCDLFEGREEEPAEPVRMTLQTVLETRMVDSLLLQRNGSTITRSEPVLVARTICVAESENDSRSDAIEYREDEEEIPF